MNKTAIVTGASRGIGYAIAQTLLSEGYNVVISARKMNDNLQELERIHTDKCIVCLADIAIQSDRDKIVTTATESFGGIDLLVNNAGVAPLVRKDMLDITIEDYDYVTDINLKGTFFLTQQVAKVMQQVQRGRIVNIGSVSSESVSVNRAEYCISKAGISMITKLFAVRLAEYNIGVFEIRPGVIQTDMIATVKDKYQALAEEGVIPAKRLGTPQEVADAIKAIEQGMLDYATGTVINCGGGMHIPTL